MNLGRGEVQWAFFLDYVALFVECQNSSVCNMDHDMHVVDEVHFTIVLRAHLPNHVNNARAWHRSSPEKVILVGLPDLEDEQSAWDGLRVQ